MVVELGMGCVQDTVTFLAQLKTQIDVVVRYRERFLVEATARPELLGRHHHAGASHRADVADEVGKIEIDAVFSESPLESVTGNVKNAQNHTGMLNGIVRIQQLCSDSADLGPGGELHH